MFVTQGAEGGCFDELFEGAKEKRGSFSFNQLPSENAQQGLRDIPSLFPFLSASFEQPSSRSSDTAAKLIRLLKACKSTETQSMPTDNRRSQSSFPRLLVAWAVTARPEHTKDLEIQLERDVRLIDSPRGVIEDQDDSNISQNATTSRIQ
ncbi:hypothetical protein BU15DRAFT_79678 [Melanogaster broomeanus]|nr:hypothetical protein BU15DRAFT_79678 [Melanogaster broomeanus]